MAKKIGFVGLGIMGQAHGAKLTQSGLFTHSVRHSRRADGRSGYRWGRGSFLE